MACYVLLLHLPLSSFVGTIQLASRATHKTEQCQVTCTCNRVNIVQQMTTTNLEILCWNVRGLNRRARRDTVRETITTTSCHLACLQETKLHDIDQFMASHLGGHRLNKYAFKPAGGLSGTRGGILLLWNDDYLDISNIFIGEFHVSATVSTTETSSTFVLTVVYGPTLSSRKQAFLHELQQLKPQPRVQWLLLGDFNMIYKASDKNNNRLNTRLMRCFREALDDCDLSPE